MHRLGRFYFGGDGALHVNRENDNYFGSLCGIGLHAGPEASSIMRALSGARCTDARLYTL